jgi:uncharacterized phiE125 gp8 family phage protein
VVDDRSLFTSAVRGIDPARLTVVTPAAAEPWLATDDAVEQFLRLDSDADQTLVTHIIAAARKHFERMTGLSLVNQTLKATWDWLPQRGGVTGREIELPRAPLGSVSSVDYLGTSGSSAAFSASNYSVVNAGCPGAFGRVVLKPDASWPELGDYRGALSVTFVAGYGAAATDIPEDIRLAVLWLATWWYEARVPVNIGNITSELPHHLNALVESHRVAFIG